MRSINLLFLIAFFPIFVIGCSAIHGPEKGLAPVETAAAPRQPDFAAAPAVAGTTSRSPDALFVALAALGIDYLYGGRSPATGFDCSGLVAHIYRDAYGLNLPTHTTAQSRMGKPVDPDQLETGDLVFYNTLGQPNTHVGIYIGDSRFIHAPRTGAAVRIESMRGSYWKSRYSGARRIVF
jgi:cell wall-associated NlpC family hydrolase